MKQIVVDANILVDYVNGYASWLGHLLKLKDFKSDYEIILPTIVIAEYFAALSLEKKSEQKFADEMFILFRKKDLTEEIAKVLGRILRHKSYLHGASIADLIIASTAIYLDAELATNNKTHFENIPALRFFDPEKIEI